MNNMHIEIPVRPARLAAAGNPAPSACPVRTVIAELNASGIMNNVDEKLSAI
jgi:hypothetical protein